MRNADGTFQKGLSGNVAGRRPIPEHEKNFIKNCRDSLGDVFNRLLAVIKGGTDKDALSASRLLLEYGIGKPKQIVTVESDAPLRELKDITSTEILNEILRLEAQSEEVAEEEKKVEGEGAKLTHPKENSYKGQEIGLKGEKNVNQF